MAKKHKQRKDIKKHNKSRISTGIQEEDKRSTSTNADITSYRNVNAKKSSKEDSVIRVSEHIDLMKHRGKYLLFSALIIIPGLFFMLRFGFKLSIDFTGGSISKYTKEYVNVEAASPWDKDAINDIYSQAGIDIHALSIEDNGMSFSVKTSSVDADKNDSITTLLSEISPNASVSQLSFETVGPVIGAETAKKSMIAFIIACFGIVAYIAYAFRNIPKPYSGVRFGFSAIIALIHDAVVVLGVFSILGHYKGVEMDPMFITALLTIMGFSVHDTIVVFDRIRENLVKHKSQSFVWISNYSILETMRRSIATSATVVITLTSLFILGGASIKWFVLALLIGVVSGTYSSIFNATPVLIIWENFLAQRNSRVK